MTNNNFDGKVIVVTGASSGIGQRTAQMLIEQGAQVIALDRNEPTYPVYKYVNVDLVDPASIDGALAAITDQKLDGLCNIAGLPGTGDVQTLWRVNYLAVCRLTEGLISRLVPGASIVNLASMAGSLWKEREQLLWDLSQIKDWDEAEARIKAEPVMLDQAYRKFKEALIVWSMARAHDFKMKSDVRINCVSPGPVETPILADFRVSLGQQNVDDIIQRTGRAATPDDIAPVILFLLSDASRWVVGMDIKTDGGLTSSRFVSQMTQ
ncbi:coniferyl-alcohol dehydrogenase [Pseudomonas syringae]|uniref:coniferyl-alcohol dehydrogenase n=1 Tax=Pseudomonas syringae TaxID=317 RepID=UPI001F2FAFF5|nr:coniferyl-alcohol dehydrogenase [Pseudomonas syringae]MCF5725192.1 SDR family oxidoreductase [Pseudomonas syringae]